MEVRQLSKFSFELHNCLHLAQDLAGDLIGLANESGDKYAIGYATTVQNTLNTLFYERLDNQDFDDESIYPKGHHPEGIPSDVYDNC